MTEDKIKRRVDPVGLVFGLAAMFASAFILSDGAAWPDFVDVRWLLASAAMMIGLGLLANSLLRSRK